MRQKKVVTQLTDFFIFTIPTKIAISKFKCSFKSITKYDFKITYNTTSLRYLEVLSASLISIFVLVL